MLECLARLSADRDPQPMLFRLLVRGLEALEPSIRPPWVAACFAVRMVDLHGHRPRIDRCITCARPYPFPHAALDVAAGGLVCDRCGAGPETLALSGAVVGTLKRLRALRWEEAVRLALAAPLEAELCAVVDGLMARLVGRLPLSARYLAQMGRALGRVAEPVPRRRS